MRWCRTAVPGNSPLDRGHPVSPNSPWQLALLSECPRGRKAVPGDSHSDSSARKVDPISLATRARFRGTAGSTRSQRALGPVPETPQVNQISRAFLAPLQGPAGLSSCPGPLVLASKGPRGRPAVPGDWGPGSKALRFNHLSQLTRGKIRGSLLWTTCRGALVLVSYCKRG